MKAIERFSWRRPSSGRPYTRCLICRKQIFADVATRALPIQIITQLSARLKMHTSEEHPDAQD